MTDRRYRVLCTRKLDDIWVTNALQHGIQLETLDFLDIRLKAPDQIRPAIQHNTAPFVFTSRPAVLALSALATQYPDALKTKDCFCISGQTTSNALEAGFNVRGSARDVSTLAQLIIESRGTTVLHCSSQHRRPELEQALSAAGIEVAFCEVYEKDPTPSKVTIPDAIMFYSPSQVDAYLQLNKLDNIPVFCIGSTTAAHLAALGHKNIHIAPQSSTESILQLVIEHLIKDNGRTLIS